MVETFNWTVDLEHDFGGRTNGTDGIDKGLPLIFKLFREHNVKALFFVSTEVLKFRPGVVQDIINQGHEIGNHGHFHAPFKEPWRHVQNKEIADTILKNYTTQDYFHFRAPKFSYPMYGHLYSDPTGHVGLLKYMWFGGKPNKETIFYLHPFDIIGGKESPNLFCKIWYAHPKRAYETFINLVTRYPGDNRLLED